MAPTFKCCIKPGTDKVLHVTFASPMLTIKYHVNPSNHAILAAGNSMRIPVAYNLATGGFDLSLSDYASTLVALHTVTLSFDVFGTQEG